MPKLTKTIIDKQAAGEADIFLWDDEVRGFGVRVQPTGTKSYLVRYRTQDGVQRKQKLGRCNDFAPDKGRELARKVLMQVAEGKDPLQARREDKASPTMADLEDRYTREHAKPFKKESSQRVDGNNWRLYILPALGSRKVKSIDKSDILALFGSLSDKPAAANQTLALLSKAMNLAEDWKWRPTNTNPCRRIKRFKLKKHDLILSYEQIGQLNRTMDKMVEERRLEATFADFIRLLQLTGCRKNEILMAESKWVDRSKNVLKLPDSKVGPRNIHLSEAAMDIIEQLEGKFLVQGSTGNPTLNVYRVWGRIKVEAGLPPELRLHDLRHTAGSLAHMAGMTQAQIAELLGHNVLATTEKYIHNHNGDAAVAANMLGAVIKATWEKAEQAAA